MDDAMGGAGAPQGSGPRAGRAAARIAAAGVTLAIVVVGCAGPPGPGRGGGSPRSLLVVTLDTTRADHLGCYGGQGAETPVLDALAARGTLFESAYSSAVLTLPSHASIFTGLFPPSHGVRNNGTDRLSPEVVTLAEILRGRGYRTGAYVSAAVLEAMYGLDQGFEAYDDTTPKEIAHATGVTDRDAAAVTDAALKWLEDAGAGPWMLWVHYFDPHWPYTPPDSLRERFAGRGYDAEIAWMDENIGRLLRRAGTGGGEAPLILVVGDHGEGLGDHGEETHSVFLYDETARVPLIIAGEGIVPSATRVDHVVRTADLMPTLLDLLGFDTPGPLDGVSLVPLLGGAPPATPLPAYSEALAPALMYGWSPIASLRQERWKYVHAPRPELYDMEDDPGERRNLFDQERGRAGEMRRSLEAILREGGARAPRQEGVRLSPDQEAALRSLGYVTGGDLPLRQALEDDPLVLLQGGARGLPDPKDRTDLLGRFMAAVRAYDKGDLEQAVGLMRRILDESPGSNWVRLYLASAYKSLDRLEASLAEYREVIARQPEETGAWIGAGWALMRMERYAEARAAYEKVLALNPRHTDALSSLASLEFIEGDLDKAQALYRQVLEQRPGDTRTMLVLARLAEARGAVPEAEALYRRALSVEPDAASPALGLAHLLHRTSRDEEALRAIDAAAAAHPDRADLRAARGEIFLDQGRLEDAAREFGGTVSMAPQAPQGYHGLGRVALRRGDVGAARRLFQQALRADPGFDAARQELARLGAR